MKLSEAMRKINDARSDSAPDWRCGVACGFTPLHLQTFLHACMIDRTPNHFSIEIGLFGDLLGNLQRFGEQKLEKIVVPIEWSDLDPRLGYRVTHGWRSERQADITQTVASRLRQLKEHCTVAAKNAAVVVSLPTLPLPPMTYHATSHGSAIEFELQQRIQTFAVELLADNVRVLSPQRLSEVSPMSERYDARSDLNSGFPYHKKHAWLLGNELATLLLPATPLKGIITDLDNTLWRGILGEDGLDGVHWDLDHGAHAHGLYQELLQSLAEAGVLIAVASKNEASLVAEALRRSDLVVDADSLFPIEAHWGRKSESIRRILAAWNVGEDSVTFIDDSPMEVAEVAAAFPKMNCCLFPTKDDREILTLLKDLRDRYGKTRVSEEDRIRAGSLRSASERTAESQKADPDEFLASAEAEITFAFDVPCDRSFELINKTNQFNINGRRYDEAEWKQRIENDDYFTVTVSYQDKFGPLGKIAVAVGLRTEMPRLETWVMSCRAFSRRIEHQLLKVLFQKLDCSQIQIDFRSTERNNPAKAFLSEIAGRSVEEPFELVRSTFEENCRPTFGTEVIR